MIGLAPWKLLHLVRDRHAQSNIINVMPPNTLFNEADIMSNRQKYTWIELITLKPCECNGHADTCDASNGDCHTCRDATNGPHCEVCLEGYYGDPTLEVNIPCRECPCPNTKASGHSFAERCYLDRTNNEPVCECHEEYAGQDFIPL